MSWFSKKTLPHTDTRPAEQEQVRQDAVSVEEVAKEYGICLEPDREVLAMKADSIESAERIHKQVLQNEVTAREINKEVKRNGFTERMALSFQLRAMKGN